MLESGGWWVEGRRSIDVDCDVDIDVETNSRPGEGAVGAFEVSCSAGTIVLVCCVEKYDHKHTGDNECNNTTVCCFKDLYAYDARYCAEHDE